MGSSHSQTKERKSSSISSVEALKNKVKFLEEEINDMMCIREAENKVYERELVGFAFKQVEWTREKRKLKEEIKKMRDNLALKDDKLRRSKHESRDETVEKWKQLYFVVRLELDNLIARTHRDRMVRTTEGEDDIVTELKKELKAKGEKIELLQSMLITMEEEEFKRDREIDILRQSLKIVTHKQTQQSL